MLLNKIENILMDTTGFVLRVAQAVVQLAGVVKRHVMTHSALHKMATSIESKAIRSEADAGELGILVEALGIRPVLFAHALNNLNEIQQNLDKVFSLIQNSTPFRRFHQDPVLNKSLEEIDSKLTALEHFFRSIGILGSMISSQSKMRVLVLGALNSPELLREKFVNIQLFLQDMESLSRALSGTRIDCVMKGEARIAFEMGLNIYGDRVGKSKKAFKPLHRNDFVSAAQFFRKACRLGVKEAYRHLGDLYYEGHGVENCYHTAVQLYKNGAARNDAAAKFMLGWCYEFGQGVEKDGLTCVKYLSEAVDGGSGEAMADLGFLKLHGKLVSCDYSRAYQLLKKADKKGTFAAKESLAVCYDRGIGEDRDPVKAFQTYRECFDGGRLLTTAQLVHCYDTGSGVQWNPYEATKVLERCVNSGTWHSDFHKAYLGLRLIQGNGVKKDVARGKAIIIDSTKSGSAYSWNALGDCYRHGLGFRKDIRKSKEFYKKAIDSENGVRGVVASFVAMGEIVEYGDGVTASIIQANKYYLGAAERLSSVGQWKVANALENGIGMKKNAHRAVHYFRLCANSGNLIAQRKSVMYYMKGHGVERPRGYIREVNEEAG